MPEPEKSGIREISILNLKFRRLSMHFVLCGGRWRCQWSAIQIQKTAPVQDKRSETDRRHPLHIDRENARYSPHRQHCRQRRGRIRSNHWSYFFFFHFILYLVLLFCLNAEKHSPASSVQSTKRIVNVRFTFKSNARETCSTWHIFPHTSVISRMFVSDFSVLF